VTVFGPELALTLTPIDDDERLMQAEAAVRSYCRWHIAGSREDTVTIYPRTATDVLMLPSLYVTAVTSVTDGGTLLDPSAYRWTQDGYLRRTDGQWWSASTVGSSLLDGIVVEFTHGYTEPPADVAAVVQSIAAVSGNGALKSTTSGPFSETYSTDLSTFDKARLAQYRIPVV
jgi:hypothetical protein